MANISDKELEQALESKIKSRFSRKDKKHRSSGGGGAYFIAFVGAIVYYMQAATSFTTVVTGILKALVWPAIIVYKLLESFYGVV
ncbi:hypothetical protein KC878_04220 [Candidatus Saccharibacteria bacterium]|nr:hypothetical protein [Candidatus Saccharibacteria bacterium]MCB9821093.1 hypothetical protein [Candidatus Nomurabacteria bacterium]